MLVSLLIDLTGQSINTSFGKNRIQYHDDFNNWKKYETENFLVYWYGKGEKIANTVIQMAELDHDDVQQLLEHRINDKIEIVVYIDLTDLKQSNIGYEEAFSNQTGKTKIINNKMFVYFDGDHNHLRRQIREGIASVYLNSILEGSNLQEIVQNAILLDLPEWFRDGLISYVGSRWDYELDDELRDIVFQDEKYFSFKKLEKEYPKIAGHSLWYYLDLKYGKSSIANILYLTRINRNLKSSFLYVLNQDFETLLVEWEAWLKSYYETEQDQFNAIGELEALDLGKKKYVPASNILLSPDSNKLLLTENSLGKFKVFILDLRTGKKERLFKSGVKNDFQATNYVYPLITWHESSREISLIYEDKDLLYIRKYDLQTNNFIEQVLPENIQRIYSMDYWDETRYILSGSLDGYSDILVYDTKGRSVKKITDDFFDDGESEVVQDENYHGVLFRSNRTDNELMYRFRDTLLPLESYDLFYLDLSDFEEPQLKRLTDTPTTNESQVDYSGGGSFTYLSERNGFLNLYYAKFGEVGKPLSNYNRNIILKSTSRDKFAFQTYHDGEYKIFLESIPETEVNQKLTNFYKAESSQATKLLFPILEEKEEDDYPDTWKFQTEYEDPENLKPISSSQTEQQSYTLKAELPDHTVGIESIIPERASPSRIAFKIDDITTKLDNSVLFEGLESYIDGENELNFSAMGLLLKARTKDLFEDYILEGGVRIPTRFNGTEYFFTIDNNKKLIDKRLSFYRKTVSESDTEGIINSQKTKTKTFLAQYRLKYPFSIYRSLRGTIGLRDDKQFSLSSDTQTFNSELSNDKRLSLKIEYVYDNAIDVGLNIKHGTRYKFYTEVINGFDFQFIDGFAFDASNGFTTVVGYDARHYVPIGKHAAFALRSAGATSLGNNKILYYLGGSEADLLRKFDELTAIPDKNFAFRTPAAHLRGFNTNIRNGSTFVLANTELRLPVFKMLGFEKMRLGILRELQLVGFYDVGMAWHGSSPFSDENPINTVTLENPPIITVTVQYFRDPLVMSYGVGMRTTLFGYLVRLDYGWGVETRVVQKPRLHLSLGVDF